MLTLHKKVKHTNHAFPNAGHPLNSPISGRSC